MCNSFLNFTDAQLNEIYDADGKNVLSYAQRTTLKEFVVCLEPYLEATLLLQKSEFSIGHALPSYRGILRALTDNSGLKYCEKLRNNLILNTKKRLGFMDNSELHIHAAVLTPKVGKRWMKICEKEDFDKGRLVRAVDKHIRKRPLKNIHKINNSPINKNSSIEESSQPKVKRMKIMEYLYGNENENDDPSQTDKLTISKQVDLYFEAIQKSTETTETKVFWLHHLHEWPELAAYTKCILTVPATSATVERVFSVGGAILRPSRRRLSDNIFEKLMFLKCNLHLFKNELF